MDFFNTAQVYRFVLFILGIGVTLLSLQMICQALFPDFVRRSQATYDKPVKTSLVGLLCWAGVIIITTALSNLGPLAFIGLLLIIASLFFAVAGSTGLARRIGAGLPSPIDKDQPWRRTLRGCVLFLGLNTLLIGVLIIFVGGMGSGIVAWRQIVKERKAAATNTEDAEEGDFDSTF